MTLSARNHLTSSICSTLLFAISWCLIQFRGINQYSLHTTVKISEGSIAWPSERLHLIFTWFQRGNIRTYSPEPHNKFYLTAKLRYAAISEAINFKFNTLQYSVFQSIRGPLVISAKGQWRTECCINIRTPLRDVNKAMYAKWCLRHM